MRKLLGFVMVLFATLLSHSASQAKCLNMGIIPAEDPKAMMEQYKPMKEWLEKQIGSCIEYFTATDYSGVVEAMRSKKVDFAWFGPFSYVMAKERAGAEAFAVGVDPTGKTTYRSLILATPEVAQKLGITSPLVGEEGMKILAQKLSNFKKQFHIIFVDPASTSGYAVPRYYMHIAGIDEKAFKKVGFISTHDAAELAVAKKIVDMAADSDITYEKMVSQGKISKETNVILWKSPELPGSPWAYRKDLSEDLKKLREAFYKLPKDIAAGYGNIVGYRPVSDKDYTIIAEVKKVIDQLQKR